MGTKEKMEWIIFGFNSETDDVMIYKAIGTSHQIKKILRDFAKKDRRNNSEEWEEGTETILEVYEEGNRLYSYCNFRDYHCNYVAEPLELTEIYPEP